MRLITVMAINVCSCGCEIVRLYPCLKRDIVNERIQLAEQIVWK